MNIEKRKAEIQERLTLTKYPRRAKAVFTDKNDHNPLVLQECPSCHGSRKKCREYTTSDGLQCAELYGCPDCGATGLTGEVEHFFTNNDPDLPATARADGWLTCPKCGWRFTTRDRNAWTGRRHMRCGQKIRVTVAEA